MSKHLTGQTPPIHQKPLVRISKTRFIFTLILTFLVSISLVAGGVISYFSMRSADLITVDGQEIITPDIAEALRSQLNQNNLPSSQKLSQIMQALSPLQERIMWATYAKKNGFNLKEIDLLQALKPNFQEEKDKYERETKTRFNLPYIAFVKQNVDNVNSGVFMSHINSFSIPDPLTISMEYTAEKTQSTVEYKSINLKDFIISKKKKELSLFYDKSSVKVVEAKTMKVLSFSSKEEAEDTAQKLQKDLPSAKAKFQLIKDTLTIQKSDVQSFFPIQNIELEKVTSAFNYQGKYRVGFIIKQDTTPFAALSESELLAVADQYTAALKKEELSLIQADITAALLEVNPKHSSFVRSGKTLPISISKTEDAKDSRSLDSLSFASSSNEEFFLQAFNPKNYQSPVLNYMGVFYTIKVLEKTTPLFPIPLKDYERIKKDIIERERNMWYLHYRNEIAKNVKIKVDFKNMSQLFGL